ncbi:hypothetical protein L249_0374 [Ophiocordyceps polyrhachis-furcata BCC 54312]|uniref:RRM domain-containing protein n=1 Tax=Ophiocordyceps polyrhachis-furcata BCC 54312 TaxID=1330021 RepID=A0A367LDI2_9HYPO|nr:hypothetical protein L249_0374 [Ophiocordyceps polyrhachis-furcata BCC 54312]
MASEKKKGKAATEARRNLRSTAKVADKVSQKPKRKATDDSSPVSSKKPKSAKQAFTPEKSTAKATKPDKVKKPDKKSSAKEADTTINVAKGSSESEGEDNNDVLLLADEMDSGREEEVSSKVALFKPGQAVGKVPKISKDVAKTAKPSSGKRGVIYVGRIPHGFYEYEMRQYFSQFGPVTRLRLSRNKRTGASKHFAFVEFEEENTAEIVAKTMDNYLLFGHLLKVKMVPEDQIHEELWKGANRRFKKVPWTKLEGQKLAQPRTVKYWETRVRNERVSRAQRADKLKAIGYEFEAPELKDVPPVVATTIEAIEEAPQGSGDEIKVVGNEEEAAEAVETTKSTTRRRTAKKASASFKAKDAKADIAAKAD